MRLFNYITETDEPSGKAPEEKPEKKDGFPEKEEKTPEQEAEEQKVKDIESIVDSVKNATDKNQMNNAVKQTAALYKQYGEEWLTQFKKALSVDITPEIVERFMEYVKNFSEKLIHIKDN